MENSLQAILSRKRDVFLRPIYSKPVGDVRRAGFFLMVLCFFGMLIGRIFTLVQPGLIKCYTDF